MGSFIDLGQKLIVYLVNNEHLFGSFSKSALLFWAISEIFFKVHHCHIWSAEHSGFTFIEVGQSNAYFPDNFGVLLIQFSIYFSNQSWVGSKARGLYFDFGSVVWNLPGDKSDFTLRGKMLTSSLRPQRIGGIESNNLFRFSHHLIYNFLVACYVIFTWNY